MHPISSFLITISLAVSISKAEEITATVFNPTDVYPPSYSKEYAGKPVIYDFVKPLIMAMQKPKDEAFISAAGATPNLKWRLQHFIIISGDVVSARFSEGHVDVVGVFVRNIKEKQWELQTEVGGKFKFKVYDEATGKPTQSEQAAPSNGG